MSEGELAERIGMQPRTVRRWFEGKSRISTYTLYKLWDALPGFDPFPYPPDKRNSEWAARLAAQGFGLVDIGRHIGLHPEYVHLLFERHGMECDKPWRVN
jgi:transcriptional regulator with XRE-family HTH domain